MSDLPRVPMLRRRLLVAALAALGFLLAAAWSLSPSGGPAAAAPDSTTAGSSGPVVGEVTSLSGTKRLRATPDGGGRRVSLRDGSKLRLGDVLDPGAGVRATLKLTIPRSVPSDTELVFVKPSDGKRHDIRVERTGTRTTTVTVGD